MKYTTAEPLPRRGRCRCSGGAETLSHEHEPACPSEGEGGGRGPEVSKGSPLGCFSSWKTTMSCGLLRFSARMEISRPLSRFALKMASFSKSVQNTLSCGYRCRGWVAWSLTPRPQSEGTGPDHTARSAAPPSPTSSPTHRPTVGLSTSGLCHALWVPSLSESYLVILCFGLEAAH